MVRTYERLEEVQVQRVLKAIAEGRALEFQGNVCRTTEIRLLTYYVYGVKCCVNDCQVIGQYFAVEKAINQPSAKWHLNLYGRNNGQEIMMTSDHRIPKSRGGSNLISNRQPMCYPHNANKGNQLIHL